MSLKVQVASILCAFILGCGLYSFWSFLSRVGPPQNLDQYCALSTNVCVQNQVAMILSQDTVQPLVSTTIQVYWTHTNAQSLSLTLDGLEEDLGTVSVPLTLKSRSPTKSVFTGELMLPVCSEQDLTWKGTLTDGTKRVYTLIRMER